MNRLFRNNKTAVKAILAFIALFVGSFVWVSCNAAESHIEFEGGSTYVRGQTPAVGFTLSWEDAGPLNSDFECGLMLVAESANNPNNAGLQCLVVQHIGKLGFGIGVVGLQNVDEYNGSHANFSLKIEYEVTDRLVVMLRHWSNAGTRDPNKGRDFILGAYKF